MLQQSLFGALVVDDTTPSSEQKPLEQTLDDAVFTVIDVETTGLSAKKNALTEVAAIQYKNGIEQARFVTLIKPPEEIPEIVEDLTGITNEMVKSAPAPITVLTDLCRFVGHAPLIVGHNVGFDIRFITEKLQECGLASFTERFAMTRSFCTKTMAQKALPGLPSYEGVVVATRCGVVNPNPHRAENDVRMSAEILFALIRTLREQGIKLSTVSDLLNYQGLLASD